MRQAAAGAFGTGALRPRAAPTRASCAHRCHASTSKSALALGTCASHSVKGTARKRNEDTFFVQSEPTEPDGSLAGFFAVYDGHGGEATSDWLRRNFYAVVSENWSAGNAVQKALNKAYRVADSKLLSPGGWMGMGERGIGGSKCGSTAAAACVYQTADGKTQLLASNVGDSRVLLARDGKAVQLTTDHIPDDEEERLRIEGQNPNPKMALVRYVGDTWRVGGLLALSRAFGDAYLKGSLQFEGVPAGSDGYSSGFGVIAEPSQQVVEITDSDSWVIVCTDGLFANEERGGGGGLTNQQIVDICVSAGKSGADLQYTAEQLCAAAQAAGSTDDVTAVLVKLE